jgi:hypothetical protein
MSRQLSGPLKICAVGRTLMGCPLGPDDLPDVLFAMVST